MVEEKISYFEKKIGAALEKEDNSWVITFQQARLKLHDPLEINFLINSDTVLTREIVTTEDTIQIKAQPKQELYDFDIIHTKDLYAKWMLMNQLLKKVQHHQTKRLNLFICPENLLFDQSYEPYFIHYGVTESIPPYDIDQELLLHELKATLAFLINPKHSFEEYEAYSETLRLTESAKDIMDAKSIDELLVVSQNSLKELETEGKEQVHIPRKSWLINRYSLIGAVALLVPLIALSIYGYWFFIPEKNAYIKSSQHYINADFSSVIDELDSYKGERMPYVVQYQLANAYLATESLTEEQRQNLQNTLTLQSNENVFLYWIHLGRGENEEAIDLARSIEYELVILGLLKYKDEVTNDASLDTEERESLLNEIQNELDSFMDEREEQRQQEEQEQNQENGTVDEADTEDSNEDQEEETEADAEPNEDENNEEDNNEDNEEENEEE
ncbi:type VII secretion protein EssB [Alkalicoccobacillus porphyridii]|uniref:Type VII secretion protein EssB n=1 Tax=Alkalicoccobacillus porphyridii TaxID=2597270 RepID=A0A553ZU26_9BACI|nr:type VII secretion protein EssB [Alkalicoccobacillus porphyridii]TSB44903.1 type VII secretion protein EssB [Alkalicoccobacillus porphyridii]